MIMFTFFFFYLHRHPRALHALTLSLPTRPSSDLDAPALRVLDDTDQRWHVMRRYGDRPPPVMSSAELPPPLARALQLRRVVSEANLLSGGGPEIGRAHV